MLGKGTLERLCFSHDHNGGSSAKGAGRRGKTGPSYPNLRPGISATLEVVAVSGITAFVAVAEGEQAKVQVPNNSVKAGQKIRVRVKGVSPIKLECLEKMQPRQVVAEPPVAVAAAAPAPVKPAPVPEDKGERKTGAVVETPFKVEKTNPYRERVSVWWGSVKIGDETMVMPYPCRGDINLDYAASEEVEVVVVPFTMNRRRICVAPSRLEDFSGLKDRWLALGLINKLEPAPVPVGPKPATPTYLTNELVRIKSIGEMLTVGQGMHGNVVMDLKGRRYFCPEGYYVGGTRFPETLLLTTLRTAPSRGGQSYNICIGPTNDNRQKWEREVAGNLQDRTFVKRWDG